MPQRLNKPAPLERTRTFIARIIFVYLTIPGRIAIWITPRHHPWRELTSSAAEDLREMTWTTLRPRKESGEVEVQIKAQPPRWVVSFGWLIAAYVAYAVVARTTDLFPVLLPYLTDEKALLHMGAEPSAPPSAA